MTPVSARLEGRHPRIAGVGDRRHRRPPGRGHQQRVRGRGVAVDGDAVEGRVRRPRHRRLQRPRAIAASVKRKTSIVAMSGAIIPEPLAKPITVTGTPPSSTRATAPLGKVSVVMIARAARSAASAARPSRRPCHAPPRSAPPSAARRSPRSRPRRRARPAPRAPPAAAPAVASTAARPALPVKALALPELTRMANPPSPRPAAAAPRASPRTRAPAPSGWPTG